MTSVAATRDGPGGRLVLGLALATMLVPLGSTTIAVAIPAIARDLHVGETALAHWLVTSYLVVGVVGQSPAGKLGDRIGVERTLQLGVWAFGAGTLVGAVARSVPLLVAARVLMAAGGALMVPSALAVLRVRVPEERRARALGLFGALMGLSAAVGPTVGGELTDRLGWPAIFLANVPPLLGAIVLTRGARVTPPRQQARFDVLGSALVGVGLAALVVAVRLPGWTAAALAGAGLLTLGGFVAWERRAPDPVVDLALLGRGPFLAGALLVALHNVVMYSLLFQVPQLLAALHVPEAVTGRVLLGLTLAMVAGSSVAGRLTERVGARPAAVGGAALVLVGLVLLRPTAVRGPTDLLAPLVLVGLGLGVASAPAQAVALSAVDAARSGMASGLLSTVRYLGAIVGIAALGVTLAGSAALPLDQRLAHHGVAVTAWCVAAALAIVAAACLPSRRGP